MSEIALVWWIEHDFPVAPSPEWADETCIRLILNVLVYHHSVVRRWQRSRAGFPFETKAIERTNVILCLWQTEGLIFASTSKPIRVTISPTFQYQKAVKLKFVAWAAKKGPRMPDENHGIVASLLSAPETNATRRWKGRDSSSDELVIQSEPSTCSWHPSYILSFSV